MQPKLLGGHTEVSAEAAAVLLAVLFLFDCGIDGAIGCQKCIK